MCARRWANHEVYTQYAHTAPLKISTTMLRLRIYVLLLLIFSFFTLLLRFRAFAFVGVRVCLCLCVGPGPVVGYSDRCCIVYVESECCRGTYISIRDTALILKISLSCLYTASASRFSLYTSISLSRISARATSIFAVVIMRPCFVYYHRLQNSLLHVQYAMVFRLSVGFLAKCTRARIWLWTVFQREPVRCSVELQKRLAITYSL